MMNNAVQRRRPGFTLVEMTAALALMSVVVVGLASAMFIATSAMDVAAGETPATSAADAVDTMARDLYCAISFTERTATAVSFTVADRDGDATPDVIRYAWSGTPGDPLTRQYNSRTEVEVADDVIGLTLTYGLIMAGSVMTNEDVESAEVPLAVHTYTGGSLSERNVKDNRWRGQYFEPQLPAEATSWSVTRADVWAKQAGGTSGSTLVQIRTSDGNGLPTDTVLDSVTMFESALQSYYSWHTVFYTAATNLDPSAGYCLVLQHQSDSESCKVQFEKDASDALGHGYWVQADGPGKPWSMSANSDLLFQVFGKYVTSQDVSVDQYRLESVNIALEVGPGDGAPVETGVQILNAPIATGS